ncbi:MAG TPA: M36 family metallopeptidase, partial [Patescibacteria group bacterium]|nr:M36 family metallopeptidase [Patescibacteria group bacterium]
MTSKFARAPLALAVSMLLAQSALAADQTLPQVDRSLQSAGAKSADVTAPRLRVLMDGLPMVYDAKSLGVEGVARTHLERILTRNGFAKAASEAFELVNASPMRGGAQIVQFKRRINGIEVFREDVGLLIDAKSRLVAFRGSERLFEASAGKSLPAFSLGESDAAALALSAYGFDLAAAAQIVRAGKHDGEYQWFDPVGQQRSAAGAINRNPLRVKAVYFPLAEGGIVPAWYVETQVQSGDRADTEYYAHVYSAQDGRLLFRNFQQADGGLSAFSYRVWAEPAPLGLPLPNPFGRNDTPHPTGAAGFTPAYVAPSLVTLANAPFSQSATDGWLPSGATEATGNNADAYLDLADPDGFDVATDIRPNVTASGVFDRIYNVNAEPGVSADQRKAASIQQFYWINWLHDDYYDAGFAEVDGNAQADNFGRGGVGADSIKAEGQDNTGTCAPTCANNANMSTPADGMRPRMQMYVWSPVAPHTLTVNAVDYPNGTASFGPQAFNVTDDLVATAPLDACAALTNAAAVNGKIALIDRGTCGFTVKTKNAQLAGAVGVIIADNAAGALPPGLGGTDATVTIPALSVRQVDGNAIRAQLADANPDTATLFRGVGVGRDGTIDGMIISHEWGHYISNRLV